MQLQACLDHLDRLQASFDNLQKVSWKLEKRQQRWMLKLGIKPSDLDIEGASSEAIAEASIAKAEATASGPNDFEGPGIGEPLPDEELVKLFQQ